MLKCDSRVLTTQHEVRVLQQILPKREVKTRIQTQMARIKADPKSPHPQGFEANPLDTPATDLRDYVIKKNSVHQITLLCCCEWLIMAVLFKCHYNYHTIKLSVFNRLSVAPVSN